MAQHMRESVVERGKDYVLETQTRVYEEETVFVNGVPVQLAGPEAEELKKSLFNGEIPPYLVERVLSELRLVQGQGTVARVHSSLSVKKTLRNRDRTSVSRNGIVLDETEVSSTEREVQDTSESHLWVPPKEYSVQDASGSPLWAPPLPTNHTSPSIFGTVAGDENGGIRTGSSNGNGAYPHPQPHSTVRPRPRENGEGEASNHHPPTPTTGDLRFDEKGSLVSGTLDALVEHLKPSQDYYPDHTFVFAFLLSSRLFIKPHRLLDRILQDSTCGIRLLGEWSEIFPYDFRDERMMEQVRRLTEMCTKQRSHQGHRKDMSLILHNLLHRLSALEKYEEHLQDLNARLSPRLLHQPTKEDIISICSDPKVVAQQMTRLELQHLSHIGPEEFVQAFAKENLHGETASFKDVKQTKNLEAYIQWFNRLSYFVATEIPLQGKKKNRVRVVEFWIEVASECFNIGNFNSLMAIIAGLNMSPITRLRKTWGKVGNRKLTILEQQMSPHSNFTSYRSTLAAAQWRSQSTSTSSNSDSDDHRRRIIVPFFSLLVKDVYFLNEGCANRLPNGHINLEKFWQLAKQVTEFMTWQQVTCPFPENQKVLDYLQLNPIFSEHGLELASYECEAPETSCEKEREKTLRAQYGSGRRYGRDRRRGSTSSL